MCHFSCHVSLNTEVCSNHTPGLKSITEREKLLHYSGEVCLSKKMQIRGKTKGKQLWIVLNSNQSEAFHMDKVCLCVSVKIWKTAFDCSGVCALNLVDNCVAGQLKSVALWFFYFTYFLKHTCQSDKQEGRPCLSGFCLHCCLEEYCSLVVDHNPVVVFITYLKALFTWKNTTCWSVPEAISTS